MYGRPDEDDETNPYEDYQSCPSPNPQPRQYEPETIPPLEGMERF